MEEKLGAARPHRLTIQDRKLADNDIHLHSSCSYLYSLFSTLAMVSL